jgi:peptide-methionine (S)-S-oxide reductase
MKKLYIYMLILPFLSISACISKVENKQFSNENELIMDTNITTESATLGSGCFWCTEAIFLRVKGVLKVESGYSGGSVPNPTYEAVCTGKTGHAEVCQITFDPSIISFTDLLEVFFKTHDPTTLNRQGADVGTQYRSVIFYHSEQQKSISEEIISKLNEEKIWDNKIVTEISPIRKFYKAEDYHQDYYSRNEYQPYCSFVITPKIEKFEKVFSDKLKK